MGFGVIQCVVAHHPSEVGSTRGWLHDPSYSIHSAISFLVWKRASSWKEPNAVFSMDHVMSVDPDLSKISRIFSGPSSHAQLHGVLDPLNSPSAPTLHATALSLSFVCIYYMLSGIQMRVDALVRKVALLVLRFKFQLPNPHENNYVYFVLTKDRSWCFYIVVSWEYFWKAIGSAIFVIIVSTPPFSLIKTTQQQVAISPISKTQLSITSDSSSLYTCTCSKHLDTPC